MLSGKLSNAIYSPLPSVFLMEQASQWYARHGTLEEQAQIELYLGRALVEEGDNDGAMQCYVTALEKAEKAKATNIAGYIHMYIGDLYRNKALRLQAIDKFKMASECFEKAGNVDSRICAWRDMGREYALLDSMAAAENAMRMADSLCRYSKYDDMKAAVDNHWGNIYLMQGKYTEAYRCFMSATQKNRDDFANWMALVNFYIESDAISEAHALLDSLPKNDLEYEYTIKDYYHQIYKKEGDYKRALEALEDYVIIADSLTYAAIQSQVAAIESKYNYLKVQKRNDELELRQQRYVIVIVLCLLAVVLLAGTYIIYRKRIREKTLAQEVEMNRMKVECLTLSAELEKRKALLAHLKEENEAYARTRSEVERLQERYRMLRRQMLMASEVYRLLVRMAGRRKSSEGVGLTEEHWREIVREVCVAYPGLYTYVYSRCPDLSEADWRYCCFLMFGFDSNDEARLLDILPASVRTKRTRLRQRLDMALPGQKGLWEVLDEEAV